jgi:large subunit ribosomal protein L18
MNKAKQVRRQKIRYRIRKKIIGTATRPRLAVYKSNTAIYAQLIDDAAGITLVASDTRKLKGKRCEKAAELGQLVAKKAKEKEITQVVFDRSGYQYHGVVKALFDATNEAIAPQNK